MEKIMLLFDIDGTLIYSGGAGSKSIELAFKELYGIENAMENVIPDGKTDPLIIEEVFVKKLNKKPEKREIERVLKKYLENLSIQINNPGYKIIEGVKEFLEWAENKGKFLMGLATGNLEKGAIIKLKPSSLLRFFKFGGYASDSWERSEILKSAFKKGEEIAKRNNFKISEVFVIGDTPRDIEAAKKANFKSIGMATFRFKLSQLLEAKPDYAFENFYELKKFFEEYTD